MLLTLNPSGWRLSPTLYFIGWKHSTAKFNWNKNVLLIAQKRQKETKHQKVVQFFRVSVENMQRNKFLKFSINSNLLRRYLHVDFSFSVFLLFSSDNFLISGCNKIWQRVLSPFSLLQLFHVNLGFSISPSVTLLKWLGSRPCLHRLVSLRHFLPSATLAAFETFYQHELPPFLTCIDSPSRSRNFWPVITRYSLGRFPKTPQIRLEKLFSDQRNFVNAWQQKLSIIDSQ